MKNNFVIYFNLIILFFIISSCGITNPDSEDVDWTKGKVMSPPDESNISDSIKAIFYEDAARLALRNIQLNNEAKYEDVEIDSELISLYYNGLVHIYNAIPILDVDPIVKNIHAFPTPETHSLIVCVDTTFTWTRAWKNGEIITGNSDIDKLIEKYSLQLSEYSHIAVLYSLKPLNIFALGKRFEKINGVIYAEPNGVDGDGNNITANIETDYVKYEHSVGWGDCPAGCICRHYWIFYVKYNGEVEYIGSYGNQLP